MTVIRRLWRPEIRTILWGVLAAWAFAVAFNSTAWQASVFYFVLFVGDALLALRALADVIVDRIEARR